jgi:ABC-type multidrug transport system fused ATPase/permease subunit
VYSQMADDGLTETSVDTGLMPGCESDEGTNVASKKLRFRFASTINKGTSRKDHLGLLVENKDASTEFIKRMLSGEQDASEDSVTFKPTTRLTLEQKEEIMQQSQFIKEAAEHMEEFSAALSDDLYEKVEVRMSNFSYTAKVKEEDRAIRTVFNQSFVHDLWRFVKRVSRGEKKPEPIEKVVLDNISLVFKPGRMYLVLGNPGGGKEALLKAAAGRLYSSAQSVTEGTIQYNGLSIKVRSLVSNFWRSCFLNILSA